MTKGYPFLFLFLVFGSLISGPLFVINTSQIGFHVISQALAEESDGGDSGDDGGDSGDDGGDSGDDGGDSGDDGGDSGDDGGNSGAETTDESDDEKCDEKEKTDGETTDESDDEKCADQTTDDKTTDDKTTDDKTTDDKTTDKTTDDKTTDDETTDLTTSKEKDDENKQSEIEKDETASSIGNGEEYTLLDRIINDQSIAGNLINDESTDPEIVSTLLELKQEPAQDPEISETCSKSAENSLDSSTGTASDGDCSATAIADTAATAIANSNSTTTADSDTSNSTTISNTNSTDNSSTVTNATTTSNMTGSTNTTTTQPSKICNDGADNSTNSTTDQASCAPEPETCPDDVDNNFTGVSCPTSQPIVVIESAVDALGNSLSEGDLIAPQKVTFTFSATANETTGEAEQQGTQDYQYECALDDESFSSCSSPMTYEMDDGKHDFVVRLVS